MYTFKYFKKQPFHFLIKKKKRLHLSYQAPHLDSPTKKTNSMRNKTFEYPFLASGRWSSKCLVEIRNTRTESFITFVDIDEGTSVTNASEQLANELRGRARHANIRFFERYDWGKRGYIGQQFGKTIDEIRYQETNGKLHSPSWESISEETYQEIITEIRN